MSSGDGSVLLFEGVLSGLEEASYSGGTFFANSSFGINLRRTEIMKDEGGVACSWKANP